MVLLAVARNKVEPNRFLQHDREDRAHNIALELVRDFVAELRGQGRTIFMTTHNLDEADRLCDRIAVFDRQLRVVDTPNGLRRQLYGRQVVFHLSTASEAFTALVRSLMFVEKVEAIENKLVVSLSEPETHNPQIIRQLVDAGAEIQFVGEVRHSLEDIYLELVK